MKIRERTKRLYPLNTMKVGDNFTRAYKPNIYISIRNCVLYYCGNHPNEFFEVSASTKDGIITCTKITKEDAKSKKNFTYKLNYPAEFQQIANV